MHWRVLHAAFCGVALLVGTSGCAGNSTPAVDNVGTAVAQAAVDLLTATAAAASPTLPPPTVTATAERLGAHPDAQVQ